MTILVVKITGKAFDSGADVLAKYIKALRELSEKNKVVVVTGGGNIARRYIGLARDLGVVSNYWLDEVGIAVSRLNSYLLIAAMGDKAYPKPVEGLGELLRALGSHQIVFSGGLIPGQSTASVAIEAAEAVGARRVYYFSAIGYVYDKDPLRYSDAKPFQVIMASELKNILEQRLLPGEYALIDEKALDLALRSGIEIQLIPYESPEKIWEALSGKNPGTLIVPR